MNHDDQKKNSLDIPIKESPFLKSNIESEMIKKEEEKVEENLGEIKFKGPCKLFRMSTKTNKLEQRGVGIISISRINESSMYRVVMVRDKIMKLGCNHYIETWSDIRPHKTAENTMVWCTTCDKCDDIASEPNQTYVVKFKDSELSEKFTNEFKLALKANEEYLKNKAKENK